MAISLTCSCGARLEIDDKFAGQVIPCPDCQKPLTTQKSVEPPRELPASGLAVASLIVALVGGFTVIGGLAAVGIGMAALRNIARAPDKLGGVNLARAGMIVGGVLTFITLAALWSSEILGVDSLMREFRKAAELDYKTEKDDYYTGRMRQDDPVGVQRPSRAWGKLKRVTGESDDLLTIVNLREDAYILCLPQNADDVADARDKAAERLRRSDLFTKHFGKSADSKQPNAEAEAKPAPESKKDELILEVRLGGRDRTFLLRVIQEKVGAPIYLLAAGTRKGRFARLTPEFVRTFDSFKTIKDN
jgi:hypothetical protein